jgi:hypothetical protein
LLFTVSGANFISKKIKEQGFLRKSHQKTYPLDPGPEIRKNSSRIQGVKKHRISDPDPQYCLLCYFYETGLHLKLTPEAVSSKTKVCLFLLPPFFIGGRTRDRKSGIPDEKILGSGSKTKHPGSATLLSAFTPFIR